MKTFRAAEFFAGIGLVRFALEQEGIKVVFANDFDAQKAKLYAANFNDSHFILEDIRNIKGRNVPTVDLATASFPCIDLSLAGNRAGLHGQHSNTFWEFARVLEEMGRRRPRAILLENVVGFVSARRGEDLANALACLNELGYSCDLLIVDAKWFVPQSRPRVFIVGSSRRGKRRPILESAPEGGPSWLRGFMAKHPALKVREGQVPLPRPRKSTLADVVERFAPNDPIWWDAERFRRFRSSLQPIHAKRLEQMQRLSTPVWATAYRRTRDGRPVWEIRADGLSGCLRTARGGSSRQAVVEAGRGSARARWMTPREYARLQGASNYNFDGVRRNICLSAFGDAVCVPAVSWVTKHLLLPLLKNEDGTQTSTQLSLAV